MSQLFLEKAELDFEILLGFQVGEVCMYWVEDGVGPQSSIASPHQVFQKKAILRQWGINTACYGKSGCFLGRRGRRVEHRGRGLYRVIQ